MAGPSQASLDLLSEILGTGVSAERLAENLVAYRDILAEIRKLRELDLSDLHPVVVFDAGAAFEAGRS
jgi:hypothetical protein